jgi:hypothetical protein
MSGEELFKLKKADLEKYCGKEEGHRLDSQLTLQRRASGVFTVFPLINLCCNDNEILLFYFLVSNNAFI